MLDRLNKWSPVVAILALVTSIIVGGLQFWSSKVAQEAYDASMSFGRIGAEVSWAEALRAYRDTDNSIAAWEKKNGYIRGSKAADSLEDFLDGLEKAKIPLEVVQLYKTRHNQYQTLIHLSQAYKPFAERLTDINLTLPSVATLPALFRVEEEFRRTFSPISETLGKGSKLSFTVMRPDKGYLLRLHICTSEPGTCNSAATVKVWNMRDYKAGNKILWEIQETGRYYLWSHKIDEEPTKSTINEVVYSKDLANSTIIRFRSGLQIKVSVLYQ